MAKSKRSAALFEVIKASRSRGAKPLVPSRLAWLNRPRVSPFAAINPLSGGSACRADDAESPALSTAVATDEKPADAVIPSAFKAFANAARPAIAGVDLQLDPDNHQITFKCSYYAAIIGGFAIVVAIGLSFAIGRKFAHTPIAATAAPSSAELRSGPAQPQVLDLISDAAPGSDSVADKPADQAQLASSKSATTAPASVLASAAGGDAQRIIGRQYVVIQIYPDQKSADDAAALLAKNGVGCTVENGLTGWASKAWWCVVGTRGFDHIRANPDYQRYEAAINRVSDQFAGSSRFKRFEPRAYRWKETTT
jgi:hypothetical protein